MKKATSKAPVKGKLIVNKDKSVSVGKPTHKNPTVTVFGIEFEQGNDGATFGKALWSVEGTRYWGYANVANSPVNFMLLDNGTYLTWFKAYERDQHYTSMVIQANQFTPYLDIIDFE